MIPDAINPSEFLNISNKGTSPQGMLDSLMSQMGHVGGRLRGERAANSHLKLIGTMMAGISPAARLDATTAGSVQYKLGKHTVHIPTFTERAGTVNLGGVKYAPMGQMTWDGTKYNYLSGQEALMDSLRSLGPAIKGRHATEQVGAYKEAIADWKGRSLQHVRFSAKAAGGALPWALSHQLSFTSTGYMGGMLPHGAGPIAQLSRGVDEMVLDSVIAATSKSRARGSGHFNFKGGLSYQNSRQALVRHLALVAEGLATPGVQSVGVKTVRETGYGALGSARVTGEEAGRVIFSSLPSHGTGLHFPDAQMKKSIHHMRARGFLPMAELAALREAETMGVPAASNTAYHMKKLAVQRMHGLGLGAQRNVTPALRSGWELAARRAAGDHYAMQTVSRGTKTAGVLSTPLKTLGVGVRGNLTREQARVAYQLMGQLFTDSTAYVSSPYARGVLNIHQNMVELRHLPQGKITSGVGSMGGQAFDVHPLVQELMDKKGRRGPIFFDKPVTRADLFAHQGAKAGWVGTALNVEAQPVMKGSKAVQLALGKRDILLGFEATDQGLRPLMQRRHQKINQGAPILYGPKRLGLGGELQAPGDIVMAMDVQGRNFVGPEGTQALGEHGLGISSGEKNFQVATELEDLRQRGGLQRLSRNFPEVQVRQERIRGAGGAVRVEETLHYKGREALNFDDLIAAVSKTRKEMGLGTTAITHQGLGQLEEQFMAMLGPAAKKKLREVGLDSLGEALDLTVGYGDSALRAGQPVRGKIGGVKYTLRDLNMWTVQQAAMGGSDVQTMQSNVMPAIRRISERAGGHAGHHPSSLKWAFERYSGMSRDAAFQAGTGDRNFLQARMDIARGKVKGSTSRYQVMTWKDFQEKFTSVVGDYESGGNLEQFRGTHLVQEMEGGQLVPTRKSIILDMGEEGFMPLERKVGGGQGVRSRFLALPGGRSVGLETGKPAFLVSGVGDFPGLGHDTLDAIRATHGESAELAFQAAGRAGLSGEEKIFAQGHKAFGRDLKQSFTGTLVHNPQLQVGEVGMSQSNVEQMLRQAGFRGTGKGGELRTKIERIMAGRDDYFATFKTEPMRGSQESTVAKIRIISGKDGGGKVLSAAGEFISESEAIQVGPGWFPERYRDTDHDPGYLYNLAQGTNRKAKADFAAEQMWKSFQHKYMQAEYQATEQFAQMRMSKMVSKSAGKTVGASAYVSLMDDALSLMSPAAKGRMTEGLFGKSLAATMAAGPELLTPVANLRWRRMRQIMQDVSGGASLENFDIARGADSSKRMIAEKAIAYAKGDTKALEYMLRVAEESEYQVLKKEKVLSLMFGNAEAMALADPRLIAASYADELLNPANAGYGAKIDALSDAIMSMSKGADTDFLGQFAASEGQSAKQAATRLAKMMASGRQIEQAAAESQMEWLQRAASSMSRGDVNMPEGGALSKVVRMMGMDPEFANKAMGGYRGPVGDAARTSVQGAPTSLPSMKDSSRAFTSQAADLAKKLWGTKYGKPIMIGGAAIMGLGVIQTLNGGGSSGAHGSGTMGGSPVPPPPMIQPNTVDARNMTIPTTNFAYMDRPSQVRTQMHFSLGTTGRNSDYANIADASMGEFGRAPMHSGLMYDTSSSVALRHNVDASIRQRMRSSF